MSEDIDWIRVGVLFATSFEDPIAKIYEMFPDEEDDRKPTEDTTKVLGTSGRNNPFNKSSDVVANTENQNDELSPKQPTPTQATPAIREGIDSSSQSQPAAQPTGLRYWCGENGCKASRQVIAGTRPHVGMAQHYRTHHRELWLEVERLVAHEDGSQGQRCLPMRARTENEPIKTKRRRKPGESLLQLQAAPMMSPTQSPVNIPRGQSSNSGPTSQQQAPIYFTARLQYPLQAPSKASTNNHQMLSLFRNPFYDRNIPGGHYTPNIYNEYDVSRVVFSRVHDEIIAMLAELYANSLAEEFEAEFQRPGGLQRRTHLVLSGSLSENGTVDIEDCHLALGRFQATDNGYMIEYD